MIGNGKNGHTTSEAKGIGNTDSGISPISAKGKQYSKTKKRILSVYKQQEKAKGKKPTQKEIGEVVGLTDRRVRFYLKQLKKEGSIG